MDYGRSPTTTHSFSDYYPNENRQQWRANHWIDKYRTVPKLSWYAAPMSRPNPSRLRERPYSDLYAVQTAYYQSLAETIENAELQSAIIASII